MTTAPINLSTLDKSSESEILELKESFSNEALETIGAFANAQGGTLLIGVRDNGTVTGITVGARTLEDWAQKIKEKIQPCVLPSMAVKKEGGNTVGIIIVEKSHEPISVDGRYFKRVGRTNQRMSNEEINQRILASKSVSWDSQIEDCASLADLEHSLISRFVEDLNKQGRRQIPNGEDWHQTLEKLRLLIEGKPTRAAVLLFGKDVRRFNDSAYIRVGRFKSPTEIVDDTLLDGPLFEQLERVTAWFRERLQRTFVIDEATLAMSEHQNGHSLQRDVFWEYPVVALREGIVNAICHRDYKADRPTTVRLFDDHLEIENCGTLPSPLTPSDLLKQHQSYPHNKLIADAFYDTGIIEQWGSGTLRMADALMNQKLPAPQFDTTPDTFKLTFYRSTSEMQIQLRLNDRQIKALQYMRENRKLTNAEYQKLCKVSRATATRDLSELAERRLIIKLGKTGKGTEYILSGG